MNETIKNSGLIPNSKWPFNPSMQWDTYYSVIPQSLLDLGLEFKGRFQFAYELVPTSKEAMTSGLAHSPIQVYLFAWEQPVNGIYQRTFKVPNHAVSNGHPEWYIEDHYVPYEKELAPDFLFYGSGYKYNWTEINNNNTTMTNVMIGKDSNGPAMYWVVPISHPEAFKSECINYGKVCPLSSDEVSVDWSKVKVEAIINKQ